mmetsp:Transcript_25312/g.80454  ORF Transcript_25312/g.80454 Transcript_25312/m.80454 type:complete len:291 (+) Transcript_25312:290-1162(+)
MQRSCVLVADIHLQELLGPGDPAGIAVAHRHLSGEEPAAGNHMIQRQDDHHQLDQLCNDERILVVNHVIDLVDHALELDDTEQPQHSDGSGTPQEPGELPSLRLRAQDRQEPIRQDHYAVDEEPALQVLFDNCRLRQDEITVPVETHKEGLHEISCPEQQGGPVHGDGEESRRRLIHRRKRDVDQVEAHEYQARALPMEAPAAVRREGAGPQALQAAAVADPLLAVLLRLVRLRLHRLCVCHRVCEALKVRCHVLPDQLLPDALELEHLRGSSLKPRRVLPVRDDHGDRV